MYLYEGCIYRRECTKGGSEPIGGSISIGINASIRGSLPTGGSVLKEGVNL